MQANKRQYLAAVLLVVAATLVGKTLLSRLNPTNQVMLYLLAVVISGLRWGRGPTVLVSVLGVVAFDLFFVPPLYHLTVAHAEYVVTFIALLIVALVIGSLTGRLREHAEELHQREVETAALYAISRRLAAAGDLNGVVRAVVDHVSEAFQCEAWLELSNDPNSNHTNGETLRVPLRTPNGEVGQLVVADAAKINEGIRRLLEPLAAQAAVAIQRAQLADAARRAQVLTEAEKLHDALLNSISHSFRTPLASIIGSLSTLADPNQAGLDSTTRADLAETAREEAERLNSLVGNLLNMARLEAGYLRLLVEWYDLPDVIGAALDRADKSVRARPIAAEFPADLPLIPLDQALIVQVMENLLNNAAKYSPPETPISIHVRTDDGQIYISVADRGPGIPEADRERIFDKFYRVNEQDSPFGTGLGLAICKGIIEAHRGRMWAENRLGGGTVFTFTLPLRQEGVA